MAMKKKRGRDKANILDELEKKDAELRGDVSLLGMSALSQVGYVNSMRATMNASHNKQYVNLINPEFPAFFTGAENIVGKYSSGYKEAKDDCYVYRKVYKYADICQNTRFGVVFLVNHKKRKFDIVYRKDIENLTEMFGFQYNCEALDALSEGDEVKKGTVLRKSTSYDKYMNYGYGVNARFMYCLDAQTSEDSCVVSQSFAKRCGSIETKTADIPINDNHFLVNLYGDDKHYKPLPDIGELVTNGVLAAKRTLFTSQILNDFKSDSLSKIDFQGDTPYYGSGEVVDIDVYVNNENLVNNSFNRQLIKYYKAETRYYKEILDIYNQMLSSGYKVSKEIKHLAKRARTYLNTRQKWKEGDGVFSNIKVTITLKAVTPLQVGQKIVGRYGNKSVVSKILPDYKMPHREDGKRIDVLFNALSIINRTTSAPLYENSITFICERVQQQARQMTNRKDKEDLIFDILHIYNDKQYVQMRKMYDGLSEKEKDEYIESCIEDHIYIHEQPLANVESMFYRIKRIYDKYSDILKPYDMYVYEFGRWIKMMSPLYSGQMYIMKLKQTAKKGFSARDDGCVGMTDLPDKSRSHKNSTAEVSGNPIRFGEYEYLNFMIASRTADLARFTAMFRSSKKGRRDLGRSILCDDDTIWIDKTYTSRVNEIFSVYLKSLGIELRFKDDNSTLEEYDDIHLKEYQVGDDVYICTEWDYYKLSKRHEIEQTILNDIGIIEEDELKEKVELRLNALLAEAV